MESYLSGSLLTTTNTETDPARAVHLGILILSVKLHLYRRAWHGTETWDTHATPVLIVDVTLLKGLADLGLVLLSEFVEAIEKAVVLLLRISLHLIPGRDNVLDYLGRGAAPTDSQALSYELSIEGQFLPVAPGPGLDFLRVDPCANTELMFLDLDLLTLALCITALSTVARRAFCNGVSGSIS